MALGTRAASSLCRVGPPFLQHVPHRTHLVLTGDDSMAMTDDNKRKNAIFEGLQGLFMELDRAFQMIRERHPGEFSCKKGCADCCHAFFDVSYIEAKALRRGLDALPRRIRREIVKQAKKARRQLERMGHGADPSKVRMRCPLLQQGNTCALYELRPVNCRTYGVPTSFQGKAHVCPMTGFEPGVQYTTLNLDPVQERLFVLSVEVGGTGHGHARFTVPDLILAPEGLL